MPLKDFSELNFSNLEIVVFIVGVVISILIPLVTIHKKDREHFFWKNKKWYEKAILLPLLVVTYFFMRIMFLVNYYGEILYLQIQFSIPYGIALAGGVITDGTFWFLANRIRFFDDEPLMYRQVLYYLVEFMTLAPLITFVSTMMIKFLS